MPVATSALLALLSVSSLPCVVMDGDGGARGGRPTLSGSEQQLNSADGLFTIHYTQSGDDRVQSVVDGDGNGAVDSLDDILVGLETARSAYLERGYRPLVGDDGAGGSAAIDVYVVDLANNGFANAVAGAEGAEENSCYMRLAADLTGTGGELLQSVAAHELHHCIQYRYTIAAASWLYEATATWEQYNLYNSGLLEVALAVLWGTRLSGAGRPLDDVGSRFEYAGFSWWKFWTEYLSTGEERLVTFWETLREQPDWHDALDSEAQRLWQIDLEEAFLEYATWNGFACGRDDGQHYDPASMPCLLEAVSVPIEPLLVAEEAVVSLDPGSYTSAYLELAASVGDDAPRLQCSGPGDGAEALVRLIALDALGRRGAGVSAQVDGDDELDIRLDDALEAGGAALVVVASIGEEPTELRCQASWVEPVIEEEAGCTCSAQPTGGSRTGLWLGLIGLVLALGRCRRAAPHAAAATRRG